MTKDSTVWWMELYKGRAFNNKNPEMLIHFGIFLYYAEKAMLN